MGAHEHRNARACLHITCIHTHTHSLGCERSPAYSCRVGIKAVRGLRWLVSKTNKQSADNQVCKLPSHGGRFYQRCAASLVNTAPCSPPRVEATFKASLNQSRHWVISIMAGKDDIILIENLFRKSHTPASWWRWVGGVRYSWDSGVRGMEVTVIECGEG